MSSRNRRRHRRAGLPFGGPPIRPSFHHAVGGGGDDYPEWQDLRQKLNFIRNHREPSPQRPLHSHESQPGSSKTLRVHGLEEARGPEIQVPIVRKRARITSKQEAENKGNTERETVREINTDEKQHGGVGKVWHSSVMTHPCNDLAMGKTIESGHPPQLHHEPLLTKDDLRGRSSLPKAPGFCDSEEQQTPLINTPVARKRPFKSEGGSVGPVSDNEKEEVFYQLTTDEHPRNIVSEIWNNDLIAELHDDLTTFHYRRPTLHTNSADDKPHSLKGKRKMCHDDPELGDAAKRPRLDDNITGLKNEQLEKQTEVTVPQDKNEYCLRWLQWGVGRAEAEEMDSAHHYGQDSTSPRRRRRSPQAMVSDYRYDQWQIDHKVSADAQSSSSEHKPKGQKLQSSEDDELPDCSYALPQQRPSSEAQSEDKRIIQELLERFEELYKPT